jgi:hypothetical protein
MHVIDLLIGMSPEKLTVLLGLIASFSGAIYGFFFSDAGELEERVLHALVYACVGVMILCAVLLFAAGVHFVVA